MEEDAGHGDTQLWHGQSERAVWVGTERAGELREATQGAGYTYSNMPLLACRGGGACRAGDGTHGSGVGQRG